MTKEELKEQDIRLNRLCFDYHEKEKRIAELEKENAELKAYNEKLLNGDIEKHNKIVELTEKIENLQKYLDTQNSYRECAETWKKLTYAKTIIQDLLDNSDEYARQRAIDFLKECE